MQALDGVHCLKVKFYFDLVVWICPNNKVHVVPICEQKFFQGVYNILTSALTYVGKWLLGACWLELSIKELGLLDPFCPESLILCSFIRIAYAQKSIDKFLIIFILEWVLMLEQSFILVGVEW